MVFHILTAVLVVLKALGEIDWSWLMVLAPSLFMFAFATFALISAFFIAILCK